MPLLLTLEVMSRKGAARMPPSFRILIRPPCSTMNRRAASPGGETASTGELSPVATPTVVGTWARVTSAARANAARAAAREENGAFRSMVLPLGSGSWRDRLTCRGGGARPRAERPSHAGSHRARDDSGMPRWPGGRRPPHRPGSAGLDREDGESLRAIPVNRAPRRGGSSRKRPVPRTARPLAALRAPLRDRVRSPRPRRRTRRADPRARRESWRGPRWSEERGRGRARPPRSERSPRSPGRTSSRPGGSGA